MNAIKYSSRAQQSLSAKAPSFGGFNIAKINRSFAGSAKTNSFSGFTQSKYSKRFYGNTKESTKAKGIPVAFFPDSTDGKGFVVNPPQKTDKTAIVSFLKGPKGYESHPEQALKNGFQGLWMKRNEQTDSASIYTLAFEDTFSGSLEQYMQEKTQTFIDRYQSSDGKHYEVVLNPVVTNHLTKKNNVECKAALFSTGQTSLYEQPLLGKLIMLLKTPGGFWELGLHAPIKYLLAPSTQAAFTEVIRDLNIFWREDAQKEALIDKTTKVTNKQSLLD